MADEDYISVDQLPRAEITLPIEGGHFARPEQALIEQLRHVSSATASQALHKMGVRFTFMQGPLARQPGAKVVGPAVTLQFMPQREDVASGAGQERTEKSSALWAVFDTVQPGDVLVVQAWGDRYTGTMGEMLATYFKGRGGTGIVVDGCVRDSANILGLGLGLWSVGVTPNYASQASLFPWAYNVPVACGRVLVLPGDIVIADDDGAVVVPQQIAPEVARVTTAHEEWEVFSRIKLAEGGRLSTYYPLNEEGQREYEDWKQQQR